MNDGRPCDVCGEVLYKKDIRIYLGKYVLCRECLEMGLAWLAGQKRIKARKARKKERRGR